MIRVVIFDYDETLVKTLDSRIKVYIALARDEYKLSLTERQIRSAFGLPYEYFIKKLFGNVDKVESIITKYLALVKKYPNQAYENSEASVNSLAKKYLIGIVTGLKRKGIMTDLTKLNFPVDNFFYIQCGDDTVAQKPNPKVFIPLLSRLKQMGIQKSEVVYIGDDLRDYQASTKAGFHFIGVANHTTPKSIFVKNKINFVTDFNDLEIKISEL